MGKTLASDIDVCMYPNAVRNHETLSYPGDELWGKLIHYAARDFQVLVRLHLVVTAWADNNSLVYAVREVAAW